MDTPDRNTVIVTLAAPAAILLTALLVAASDPPPASQPVPPASQQPMTGDKAPPRELEPPREPSASEILRELSREANVAPRPIVRPSTPGQVLRRTVDPAAVPPNAIVPVTPRLLPDGYRIVDRPGRLTREGDYYTFSFESRSQGTPELPIRLLPNRLLEDMEIVSAGGSRAVVFIISGEVTEYHSVNYLLVQKLLTRPDSGNLK
jgi:hypothetical protein